MIKLKGSLKVYPAIVILVNLLLICPANSQPEDYDPTTGEPKCIKCHTPERSYSIDYTRDEGCIECHGPGLSDKYLTINDMFRAHGDPGGLDMARLYAAAGKKKALEKEPASTAKKGSNGYEEMVRVDAGEFTMGSDNWWPKSQPEHKKTLGSFFIDRYEVTNLRYRAFVDATGHPSPKHWVGGKIPKGKELHPVVYTNWNDADAFCRWEGTRLPTEPEWEKAARGTDSRTFPWGNKFSKYKANTPQLGNKDTMPVGSFEDGKSPYGAYDMAGNAWEWIEDWFQPYPGNRHADENYGTRFKVVRGGSWYDCTYYKCGISAPTYNRIFFHPRTINNNFGLRCAKDG